MNEHRQPHWPLALGLGAVALVRPIASTAGWLDGVRPAGPIVLTILISAVWIAVVGLHRTARALPTLIAAGLAYGVFSIALSGILSPILLGELQGPLARPIAILPVLLVNAIWGALAGLLALGVQRLRFAGDTGARR